MAKTLIILLIMCILFISGCEKTINEHELIGYNVQLQRLAVVTCTEKNMQYVGSEVYDFNGGMAVCMTESPLKIYRFRINVSD